MVPLTPIIPVLGECTPSNCTLQSNLQQARQEFTDNHSSFLWNCKILVLQSFKLLKIFRVMDKEHDSEPLEVEN